MEVALLLLAVFLVPPALFAVGWLMQVATLGRSEAAWSVPAAGFLLTVCAFVCRISGAHPLLVYVPVLAIVAGVGSWRLRRSRVGIPLHSIVLYSAFAWCAMLFLGATDFISFGGDWIEHGFSVPIAMMQGEPLHAIRSCMLCVVYADVYSVFSPDCSRYYLVQVLAASLNAGIVFVFLALLGAERRKGLFVACVLACPFVIYEVAYIWPKFFALSVAYPAVRLLYGKDSNWRGWMAGICAMLFAVLVHPLAMFIALAVPFFMPGRISLGWRFVVRITACLAVCLLLPSLLMKAVGVQVTSTIAYYPFSDDWSQAFRAVKAEEPLFDYAAAYFRRVGILGAVKSRVIALVSMVAPIAGIGRFAFWQNLIFALGPVGFVLGCIHVLRGYGDRKWLEGAGKSLFAFAPVFLGVVFSTGYMVLQVAGGHWLVLVLAAYACVLLRDMEERTASSALAVSAAWNWAFVAISAYSIRAKSPDWAPGLTANLDGLAGTLPGFSHKTPIYFADLFDYRIAIALYLISGIAAAIWALNSRMQGEAG